VKHNPLRVELDNLQAGLKHATDGPSRSVGPDGSAREAGCEAICAEWVRILKQYQATVKSYGEATAELPEVPGAEFNTAWARAESLYRASNAFRAAMFEHEHKHDCSVAHAALSPRQV